MLNIVSKAEQLWPKATDVELELLSKIFKGVAEDKAISILEDARIDCKYNRIPLSDIKERANRVQKDSGMTGSHIDCWAVHQQTGRYYECVVVANDEYGAKTQMQKYLKEVCNVEPSMYAIFVGEEQNFAMHQYRHEILDEAAKRQRLSKQASMEVK